MAQKHIFNVYNMHVLCKWHRAPFQKQLNCQARGGNTTTKITRKNETDTEEQQIKKLNRSQNVLITSEDRLY